jgi:two-component system NarL family sensor kinase
VGGRRHLSQTGTLRVFKEAGEALSSAATEQHATGEALGPVADLLGVETGRVWLRDPTSDRFYSAAVRNLPPFLREPVRMTGHPCWCLELFRRGEPSAHSTEQTALRGS